MTGSASDAAGVKAVYVALGRATRGGRCRWWATSVRRMSVGQRSCSQPRWIRTTLVGSHWTASLHHAGIPAGHYRVVFRAVDRLGNVSRSLSDGSRLERVRVKRAR